MSEAKRAQDVSLPNVIRLGRSKAFHNKDILPPNTITAYGNSFITSDVKPAALVQHITSGNAFTMGAFASTRRSKETFVSGQVVGLDLDQNISVADCLAVDFIRQYAYLIYPTPSNGKPDEQGKPIYKSRVLFILDTPITDRATWERYQRALIWYCSTLSPDPACKDAARLFYGSETDDYYQHDITLPVAALRPLADAMDSDIGTYETERTPEDNKRVREQNKRNVQDDKNKQRYYAYASRALDNMVSDLSSMGADSGRNNTLFKYGAKCGNFIAAEMIPHSECESALRGAAQASQLPQHEIDSTLSRAIQHGLSSPTDTDRLDREWQAKVEQWKQQQQKTVTINQVYQDAKAAIQPSDDNKLYDFAAIVADSELRTVRLNYQKWQAGQCKSWWDSDDIPLAHISALLNLTDTRSSTALVLGHMHKAFRSGKLCWALFSIATVADATGLDRKMIKRAFVDLERGGYMQFLKRESLSIILSSIDKEPPLETAYQQADYYTLTDDIDHIQTCLLNMLTTYYTEKYATKGLAEPTRAMGEQIGIESYAVFKAWLDRYATAKDDTLTKEAATKLRQEFEGDGHYWHGWASALKSDFCLPINWNECESIKDVRGQLLTQWITTVRDCNTQDELCRIAGCTEATVASVFKAHHIATIQQTERIELAADFTDLREVMRNTQRDKRCMIWRVSWREKGQDGWHPVAVKKAGLLYARNAHNITHVFMIVNKPSVQKIMTSDEIELVTALRDKIAEAQAATKGSEITTDEQDTFKQAKKIARSAKLKDIPPMIELLNAIIARYGASPMEVLAQSASPDPVETQSDKPARAAPLVVKSHDWQSHRMEWLHRKIAEEIFMFTDYELIGECVYDTDKNLIFKAANYDLAALVTWLNDNASDSPKRSSADFHGIEIEDYTDEIRAELKRRYDNKMKPLYDNLVPDFDMPDETKVIQMPLAEKQPLTERQQLIVDTINNRMDREYQGYTNRFADNRNEAYEDVLGNVADCEFIDRFGYTNVIKDGQLFIDGIKQRMTADLWQHIEMELAA